MRRGYKIAQERGIKLGKSSLRYTDGGKDCACALGMALIGKYGPEKSKGMDYDTLDRDFGTYKNVTCLLNTVTVSDRYKACLDESDDVKGFVYKLNDLAYTKPDVIAEKLEKCGL